MRPFFYIGIVLLCFSIVAWAIYPAPTKPGRAALIWVSDDAPTRRQTMDLFDKSHPDIDLKIDPNNSGMEKIIVQSLAGVGPDLFDCYSPRELSAYVNAGIAWDITNELPAINIDIKRDVWPLMWGQVLYNGRAYGIAANASADALWFNKQIFAEAHLPLPDGSWNWEQLSHWRNDSPYAIRPARLFVMVLPSMTINGNCSCDYSAGTSSPPTAPAARSTPIPRSAR